ncbi:MAG: hypothetical protein GTN60_03820 [Pseudomonas stutzeri]|uniref:hypothetical protein n=1 Tax=Stutzerimonas frequens TaxID=2968969 RepID=UPI0016B8990F|nr:hypothetical protein [Stutzerimonas frequens]NIM30439.1 hypothetical protein [Stutzerimonas stutzeri]MDL0441820.1 hypothetical protein [Stutzerimonas frequens]NIM53645.1 hypothetical protein [Stutzerimonas stutzeri]NIM85952.1 hypothetical protein [Stutzerimonas stutzeri]NIN80548.1 hypothetical protein [Stutzerimonas stutzeri]
MVGRPYEYPSADARSPKDPNTFCPKEKILALYNQEHRSHRVRMSPDVEAWFEAEGRKRKWVAFHFSAAGCTLIAHLLHRQDAIGHADGTDGRNVVSLDKEARRRGR